jgi:hypothetical protein
VPGQGGGCERIRVSCFPRGMRKWIAGLGSESGVGTEQPAQTSRYSLDWVRSCANTVACEFRLIGTSQSPNVMKRCNCVNLILTTFCTQ